jgi:hypothetical protein
MNTQLNVYKKFNCSSQKGILRLIVSCLIKIKETIFAIYITYIVLFREIRYFMILILPIIITTTTIIIIIIVVIIIIFIMF